MNKKKVLIDNDEYLIHSADYVQSISTTIDSSIYNDDYIQNLHDSAKTARLNEIRLSFLVDSGLLSDKFEYSRLVTDVGYGNGAFLEHFVRERKNFPRYVFLRGYDISYLHGVDPYRGRELLQYVGIQHNLESYSYDIITMFDVLEHVDNPKQFILDTSANAYVITIPLFHSEWIENWEMFRNWKHRKPGEHFHFWTEAGLNDLFESCGYERIFQSYAENEIRATTQPNYPAENVYTGIFQKK